MCVCFSSVVTRRVVINQTLVSLLSESSKDNDDSVTIDVDVEDREVCNSSNTPTRVCRLTFDLPSHPSPPPPEIQIGRLAHRGGEGKGRIGSEIRFDGATIAHCRFNGAGTSRSRGNVT